jgi:hypothetical protein
MVGDGGAVRVTAEIVKHILGPPKDGLEETTQFLRNSRLPCFWALGIGIPLSAILSESTSSD